MKRPLYLSLIILALVAACAPQRPSSGPRAKAQEPAPPIFSADNEVVSKGVIAANVPTIKVAILLPLSGDSQAIGNAMLDAANMALYDSYLSTPSSDIHAQIILVPKDAGNRPADAATAAKQAIEQGATFIIGPLFSQSVSAVVPIAREHHIPMLTFSNNKAIAANDVFAFGFLPEQQVQRMADYAFLHNYARVAVLVPNDPYGKKIQETLFDLYNKKGGLVSPTEFYAPSPANIEAAVARLGAAYNNLTEERRFQAIFIADGGYQLKTIVGALKKTTIDPKKVKLLGTGLWDDKDIAKIPEMSGAWFSSSPPEPYERFEQRFTATYNYKPMRLASLAYDAVALATAVTMKDTGTPGVSVGAITDASGFESPANGLFRLHADGTSDRKLSIMEVTPEGFKVIDAAPKNF